MANAGWVAQAQVWRERAIVDPSDRSDPHDPADLADPAAPAGQPSGAEGGLWAAALGSEAGRLSAYLGLLARAAAFARAAGVTEAALADLATASSSWPVALRAVAEAVADEAGVDLRVVRGSRAQGDDPPLALLAVDLDDPDVRVEAAARLAADPGQLLPHVVVCLRSAQPSPLAGPERTTRDPDRARAGEAAATSADEHRPEPRLTLPPGRRLQVLSTRPWPAGPSAPGAVEWACTYHVTDHPLTGVLHLPTRPSRSASRERRRH